MSIGSVSKLRHTIVVIDPDTGGIIGKGYMYYVQHRGTLVPNMEIFDVKGEELEPGDYVIQFTNDEPVLMVVPCGVQ